MHPANTLHCCNAKTWVARTKDKRSRTYHIRTFVESKIICVCSVEIHELIQKAKSLIMLQSLSWLAYSRRLQKPRHPPSRPAHSVTLAPGASHNRQIGWLGLLREHTHTKSSRLRGLGQRVQEDGLHLLVRVSPPVKRTRRLCNGHTVFEISSTTYHVAKSTTHSRRCRISRESCGPSAFSLPHLRPCAAVELQGGTLKETH